MFGTKPVKHLVTIPCSQGIVTLTISNFYLLAPILYMLKS